jgi:hypothetical protein
LHKVTRTDSATCGVRSMSQVRSMRGLPHNPLPSSKAPN